MVQCAKCKKNRSPKEMVYAGAENLGNPNALFCIDCANKLNWGK